ncbi:organic hydroperoxide resistance protein [bacterium]|nr:MAG: organic hydroperoxide resistance protein [bacterium]
MGHTVKSFYTASATATSGREGRVVADEPKLDLSLSVPKEFGGPGGEGTNPEQLFAGGYASCFSSAVAMVARMKKVQPGDFTVTGHVSIGKDDSGAFGLAVELQGRFPSLARAQAEELMHAAHEVCPYSNATRGNVEVTLTVAEAQS